MKAVSMNAASQIYLGQVMHQRLFPMQYQFRYGVMSLKVDVDRIAEETAGIANLSLNKWNLYSVYFKDYGPRDGSLWRPWLEKMLADYGLKQTPSKIELVCFPRFMGIVFNPLAMWYAYDQEDHLIAVVAEVSNTFGQWHHYVLTADQQALPQKLKAKAQKVFHVSPFINMNCEYFFRFSRPQQNYQLSIFQHQDKQPMLIATQVGKAQALNSKNLWKAALKHPFNTLKVLLLIHWWALKIWLKGGKFHKTPKALQDQQYSHTEMRRC